MVHLKQKISYIIGLLLFLSFVGCSNDKPWVEKSYFEDGTLKSEVEMVGDTRNGVAKSYFPNGELETVIHYENGVEHGVSREYYDNGKLHIVAEYRNGKPNGRMLRYFKNGNKSYDSELKDGKPIGFTIGFYEDGDTMAFYDNGRAVRFFENGKIEQITCSQNEDLNSIRNIRFSPEGEIIKREEPLYCLTSRDTLLLDEQYPDWKTGVVVKTAER
ncbi:toxin-antitoxin system YwqK family antitoxin [Pontibacter rugosus]|jgi:antitoxin component YwqK of YwqJK toxin-antitoxin module|uniref:Toxin-antitoxin system YwqK family antitoxin n=1 Tax=Pontibacter rugosus TaxID=1745966 RepID=A0ABW3SMM9_9BACT